MTVGRRTSVLVQTQVGFKCDSEDKQPTSHIILTPDRLTSPVHPLAGGRRSNHRSSALGANY